MTTDAHRIDLTANCHVDLNVDKWFGLPKGRVLASGWGWSSRGSQLRLVESEPYKSKALENIIEQSKWILELQDDWDDQGALACSEETVKRAWALLRNTASELHTNFDVDLLTPRISPGPDASIDLHWETEEYELLINIPPDAQTQASFYGDDYGATTIKGTFDPSKVQPVILTWFKSR